MEWAFLVALQVLFQPCLTDLFIVEAEQTLYKSEFGGMVVMSCKFSPKPSNTTSDLKVIWHRTDTVQNTEVVRRENGKEHIGSSEYQGRVTLLGNQLQAGWAKLQISNLKVNDSGTYQCLVQTKEGTDYKTIALSLKAQYKPVTKRIAKTDKKNKVLLSCQSQGYPESPVVWLDKTHQNHNPQKTVETTSDQRYKITSRILVDSSKKTSYTCSFTNDGQNATFHIPDEIPSSHKNKYILFVVFCMVPILLIAVGIFFYRRLKENNVPVQNSLADGQETSTTVAVCMVDANKNEEETKYFTERKVTI